MKLLKFAKKIERNQLVVYLLILINLMNYTWAQKHPILDNLNIFSLEKKIFIQCVISSGSTCNGIFIYQSFDSLNFDVVGHINGVCGDVSEPKSYEYVIENPIKNKDLFFKLEFGDYGFTEIIKLHVLDTREFQYQIRPNPFKNKTKIYFNNEFNKKSTLSIYSSNCFKLKEFETQSNVFELDLENFPSAIYFFTIKIDTKNVVLNGKFIIE